MKKFKRIIINAISFVIAMFLLISPLEVLAGTANTTNIIESSNKYVDGDSVFYLSHAEERDTQASISFFFCKKKLRIRRILITGL